MNTTLTCFTMMMIAWIIVLASYYAYWRITEGLFIKRQHSGRLSFTRKCIFFVCGYLSSVMSFACVGKKFYPTHEHFWAGLFILGISAGLVLLIYLAYSLEKGRKKCLCNAFLVFSAVIVSAVAFYGITHFFGVTGHFWAIEQPFAVCSLSLPDESYGWFPVAVPFLSIFLLLDVTGGLLKLLRI